MSKQSYRETNMNPPIKEQYSLIPWLSIKAMTELMTVMETQPGSKHYPGEWRKEPIESILNCVQRHLTSHYLGDTIDPETGKPHLINALTRLAMACENYLREQGYTTTVFNQEGKK